jgi:hypothetical protein
MALPFLPRHGLKLISGGVEKGLRGDGTREVKAGDVVADGQQVATPRATASHW